MVTTAQSVVAVEEPVPRGSAQKANQWYAQLPWLVGCNYVPATAINQIETWQAECFDPETIDRELGWAESLGFNTVRIFSHWGSKPGSPEPTPYDFAEITLIRQFTGREK